MTAFRTLLITLFLVLFVYTGAVIGAHGWNLFTVFFGDVATMGWPGQFNTDFTMMLMLSGLWTAWRGHFTGRSIARGLLAMFLGTSFLAPYLLYLSFKERGDVPRMLVGDRIGSAV